MRKWKILPIFLYKMKKTQLFILWLATVLLAWCFNSNNTPTEIDADNRTSDEWLSVQEVFNKQIEQTQYLIDFNDYLSYNTLSEIENKPYTSEYNINAQLDNNSAIQWWVKVSQNKVSKSHNLENSEISVDIDASMKSWELDPFAISWNLSLLHKDDDVYANLHSFWLYMWEDNMAAKMYSLLSDMLIDKWIDLEANEWGLSLLSTNNKLWYLIWSLENLLEIWEAQNNANFIMKVSDLIEAINSYIDLWIYNEWLILRSTEEIQYSELSDGSVQKSFTWSFEWTYSTFDMSFIASKKWVSLYFYNIKQLDKNTQEFKDIDVEVYFSIQENKKSEYAIEFKSTENGEKMAQLNGTLKYATPINLSAKFELKPNNILTWEKISWDIDWTILKKFSDGNEIIPEITWEVIWLSALLSTL